MKSINFKSFLFTFCLLIGLNTIVNAQKVGINTESVNSDAVIEINGLVGSTYKGMLPPKMTTTQRNNMGASSDGLVIYNSSTSTLQYYNAGRWSDVGSPKGTIVMWSGSTAPDGWAICNGGSGTPNLSGRFIVGLGTSTDGAENYTLGENGGDQTVTLTTSQMPSHQHDFSGTTSSDGSHTHQVKRPRRTGVSTSVPGTVFDASTDGTRHTVDSEPAGSHTHSYSGSSTAQGSGSAHENRPPYYALAYIMKL